MLEPRAELAAALMTAFARRTGLVGTEPQRRYLWTDAFALCNFIALRRATDDRSYESLAGRLVHDVHHVLGRHRPDDPRTGWLSGLPEEDGRDHPTRGGLRIGKPLQERARGEPMDERLEWERDGQYFHYLTRWMHALDQQARATGDPLLNVWARELAVTAHQRFTYATAGIRRMYWKMSIDLDRPVVPSMGHHDPVDGLVTALELEATASVLPAPVATPDLADVITDFASMIEPQHLATPDPLGLGGLLVDAYLLVEVLKPLPGKAQAPQQLVDALLLATLTGMHQYSAQTHLAAPANRRLAFRELGLSIGLAALASIDRDALTAKSRTVCTYLDRYSHLRDEIEMFWCRPEHRASRTWTDHQDINDVMLATSLVPNGFLSRGAPAARRSPHLRDADALIVLE